MIRKNMNLDEVRAFILEQTSETKIYLGGDSERFQLNGVWHADYINVVVVHKNGKNGCRVFGSVVRERDYDQQKDKPRMRLMNEVYKVAELFQKLEEVLVDREIQIHLDINPDMMHGSSCVVQQAVGYIKGVCGVDALVKPDAFAASFAADRMKHILQ